MVIYGTFNDQNILLLKLISSTFQENSMNKILFDLV